jgi:hypothetical protein
MTRQLSPSGNAPEHDLVMTPQVVADAIARTLPIPPDATVLDPAAGDGAFFGALQNGRRRTNWCEISRGVDFFKWDSKADWIVTNPPWSKIRPFTQHALTLAPNVAWLCTLSHFVTRARLDDLHTAGAGLRRFWLIDQPPAPWPASGFALGVMWICKGWTGGLEFDRSLLARQRFDVRELDL